MVLEVARVRRSWEGTPGFVDEAVDLSFHCGGEKEKELETKVGLNRKEKLGQMVFRIEN